MNRLIGKNNLNIVRLDALNYKNSPNSTNKSSAPSRPAHTIRQSRSR